MNAISSVSTCRSTGFCYTRLLVVGSWALFLTMLMLTPSFATCNLSYAYHLAFDFNPWFYNYIAGKRGKPERGGKVTLCNTCWISMIFVEVVFCGWCTCFLGPFSLLLLFCLHTHAQWNGGNEAKYLWNVYALHARHNLSMNMYCIHAHRPSFHHKKV